MKKIIALSLFPAFLSADFSSSFVDSFGRQLGSNFGNSKWVHYSVELFASLGGMARVKSSDCEKDKTEKTSETKTLSTRTDGEHYFNTNLSRQEEEKDFYTLKGHPLLRMGAGLRSYAGLGTKNFQIGCEFGFGYLFNGSLLLDTGLNFYYRYLNFFGRVSGGIQYAFFACEGKRVDKFGIVGWYGRVQFGYFFYESFYASLAVSYSKFANQKRDNGSGVISEHHYSTSTNNEVKGKSVSVFISVGLAVNGYEDNLKSAEETATSQELAKLRARDQYKAEKQKKELEKKKAEEADKEYEEYQKYLKSKKNKIKG